MRRSVERYLEDPLAEELLKGTVREGDPVLVTVEDGKLIFRQQASAAEGTQAAVTG
jgi:ATP-dependent Clp protease ATP-binding subunit ClpC